MSHLHSHSHGQSGRSSNSHSHDGHSHAQTHGGHSHDHGGHSHGQAGHSHRHGGHSHGESPYSRECQAPTSAATYSFLTAFVGALSAVSIPTHITGYFLPTVEQTALLWAAVAARVVYSALCAYAFSLVLDESVSERYRAPIEHQYNGREKEGGDGDGGTEEAMGKLRRVSWMATAAVLLETGLSCGLFVLSLPTSGEEWVKWCAENAILFTDTTDDDATTDTCAELHLNQTYLVLGIPAVLLILELLRSLNTHRFVALALDRPLVAAPYEGLPQPEPGEPFSSNEVNAQLCDVRELARRRRRRIAERRRREWLAGAAGRSGSEDEERLLWQTGGVV